MRREQIDYARSRLDNVYSDKAKAIKEACTVQPSREPPTYSEFLKMVNAGKIVALTPLHDYHITGHTALGHIWDIRELLVGIEAKLDLKEYNRRMDVLKVEHVKVLDQLILGDAKEALAMIEAFSKLKI